MNHARIHTPEILQNKTKKQIKDLIEENILVEDYKNIAISYYVQEECQVDIAMNYNVNRKTIQRILNRVIDELKTA